MPRFRQPFALALLACLVFLASLPPTPAAAQARRYEIAPQQSSRIVFESSAPLETFQGKTDQVQGWVSFDASDLTGPLELEVRVPLATFDTGMKKRNQHMRDNHLETDRFPEAVFRGTRVLEARPTTLAPGAAATVVLDGTLDLHGVKVTRRIPLTLQLDEQGQLLVRGEFPVLLSEHAIERPKFLVMKLADEQQVSIQLEARPVGGGS